MKRRRLFFAAALALTMNTAMAQPPAATSAVAGIDRPLLTSESREVVAEGRAAIDFGAGGVDAAREAAKRLALRNAVERVAGVYVSARSLTQNFQMIRDQVITRSDALAVPLGVLREEIGVQDVRVVLRARVYVRPLAEQIRALGLARAWRVRIAADPKQSAEVIAGAVAQVEKSLTDAGFAVMSGPSAAGDTDLVVTIAPAFTQVAARELSTAAGTMTMHTIRGEIVLRATRAGTGEVVASVAGADTVMHVSAQTARAQTASGAVALLAPKLADALLVLPAASSQPVQLSINGLSGAADVDRLEDALLALGAVQNVERRSYASGRAVFELDVLSDAATGLSRELERVAALSGRRLTVTAATRDRIDVKVSPKSAPSPTHNGKRPAR